VDELTTKKVNIFYCYADHADKDLELLKELDKHLLVPISWPHLDVTYRWN
jgi:hypothetical protein